MPFYWYIVRDIDRYTFVSSVVLGTVAPSRRFQYHVVHEELSVGGNNQVNKLVVQFGSLSYGV